MDGDTMSGIKELTRQKKIVLVLIVIGVIGSLVSVALIVSPSFHSMLITINSSTSGSVFGKLMLMYAFFNVPVIFIVFLGIPGIEVMSLYHELGYRWKGIAVISLGSFYSAIFMFLLYSLAFPFFIKAAATLILFCCFAFLFPGIYLAVQGKFNRPFVYLDAMGVIIMMSTSLLYGLIPMSFESAFGYSCLIGLIMIGVIVLKEEL